MNLGEELRADAVLFFDWCPFNLRRSMEALDAVDKRELESGTIPRKLCDAVRTAWIGQLKSSLPWDEQFAVIRKVLPNPRDYDAWMNCSTHQLSTLPRRLRTAVANGQEKRANEIHDAFFANNGEARLAGYLRVWQSRERASNKLANQAWGYRCKKGGGASVGAIEIDSWKRDDFLK